MKLKNMAEAQKFLQQFVTIADNETKASFGFERARQLMARLGNPQNKIKVIHVAGTSGKGSTCHYLSALLAGQGFKVGLTISPHILDLFERIQLNNIPIAESEFCQYLTGISPVLQEMADTKYGRPSFFEVMMALAYFIFEKQKVDYAVVETGLGGRYDASNTVSSKNKVAVITKIGFDHTEILGHTLKKIATEKAAIIHSQNTVISTKQTRSVEAEIIRRAKEQNAGLYLVPPPKSMLSTNGNITMQFRYKDLKFRTLLLATPAKFQAENTAVALTALYELSLRDGFPLDVDKIQKSLISTLIPGRFTVLRLGKKDIVIDGAHNPSKMAALIRSLKSIYPKKKFPFLISVKKGKQYREILKHIIPHASLIIITKFKVTDQGWRLESEKTDKIAQIFETANFHKYIKIEDVNKALQKLLKVKGEVGVVTGSLYLVSQVYKELKII